MEAETIAMKEGDIFRWCYREPSEDNGAWGRYHCCSRIAFFRNGRLRDTFWMVGDSFGSDGRSFGSDDLPRLELTFVGNFSDLEKAPEYQADYYADADIVNLNHSNSTSGNFYLRKGAVRSAQKMLEVAQRKLEQSQSDERRAARKSEELHAAISRIEAGQISDVYL